MQFREDIILVLRDHGNGGLLVHRVEQLPAFPRCAENVGIARREILLDLIVVLVVLVLVRLILVASILFGGLAVILCDQGSLCVHSVMAKFPAVLPRHKLRLRGPAHAPGSRQTAKR